MGARAAEPSRASAADARLPPTNKSKAGGGPGGRGGGGRIETGGVDLRALTAGRPGHPACFTDTRL